LRRRREIRQFVAAALAPRQQAEQRIAQGRHLGCALPCRALLRCAPFGPALPVCCFARFASRHRKSTPSDCTCLAHLNRRHIFR
jgi:hypothetical protein